MRVASESIYNLFMLNLIAQLSVVTEVSEKSQSFYMHRRRLTVHIGHVQKAALALWQQLIMLQSYRLLGQRQGRSIISKSFRTVPKKIS